MTEERAKRKLSGILSADAAGYSRLMRLDEAATVAAIKEHKEAMASLIHRYNGRVVDSPGDNLLAEFASVVDAVECAVEIQKEIKSKNKAALDDRKMEFRIGIHLGDVIEDEERIYGDGVNIAARIEGLSEQGSICISRTTYDSVKNKLSLGYEYLGEHTVKNISEPVIVYKVLIEPEAAGKVIGEKRYLSRFSRKTALAAIIVLLIVAGGLIGWNIYLQKSKKVEPASVEKMVYPLPDKPSIAVLPFTNMSEDPNQEYFSDGLSDQIINSLSKIPNLFVIARNSTFTYKGKPVKVQKVAEDLGVRYVLEGSVQKSADRVRINAQLIDATTGLHRWSERYDKDLKDIFAIQDEITFEIIKALQVKLTKGDMARVTGKGTKNLDSYLMALQAHEQFFLMNRQGSVKAKQLAKEAIDLDPDYAFPYTTLANAHMLDVWFKFSKSPKESMKQADEALQKALALDDSDPRVHISFCNLYTMKGAPDKALKSAEIAVELSPSGARAVANLGSALLWVGRNNEAIHYYKQAIRLNPFPPSIYFRSLGRAYRLSGRYEDAVTQLKKALQLNPDDIFTHLSLILAYTKLDRDEEAKAEAVEVLRIHPKFSVEYYVKTLPYKDQSIIDDIKASLRKSGLD